MPVKRRNAKRRASPAHLLMLWGEWFEHGWSGFAGEEEEELQELVRDIRQAIEPAWREFGAQFLRDRDARNTGVPWALAKFGEP